MNATHETIQRAWAMLEIGWNYSKIDEAEGNILTKKHSIKRLCSQSIKFVITFSEKARDWQQQNMSIQDISSICCAAYGTNPRPEKPCLILKGLMSHKECQDFLKATQGQHAKEAGTLCPGDRSEFYAKHESLSYVLFQRIRRYVPSQVQGSIQCLGLRSSWQHARYFPGQSVLAHSDQRQRHCDDEPTVASRLSLTVYLDEDFEGGELAFGTGADITGDLMMYNLGLDIEYFVTTHLVHSPKRGDAAIFYQAVPEFTHCVLPMKEGVKTIIRSDIMYRFLSEEKANQSEEICT